MSPTSSTSTLLGRVVDAGHDDRLGAAAARHESSSALDPGRRARRRHRQPGHLGGRHGYVDATGAHDPPEAARDAAPRVGCRSGDGMFIRAAGLAQRGLATGDRTRLAEPLRPAERGRSPHAECYTTERPLPIGRLTGAPAVTACRAPSVARPGGPTGQIRKRSRVEDHDLVARNVDQPFLGELMEVARHDLAHGPDCVGKVLLTGAHDEVATDAGSREQEQLVGKTLANRAEGLLGDVVEQPVQLSRQLLCAHARDAQGPWPAGRAGRRCGGRRPARSSSPGCSMAPGPPMTSASPATSPLRA